MAPGKIDKWLDVQHRYMAIAQRALQRPALHAVAAMAATAVTVAVSLEHLSRPKNVL